jgi:raffinose/stachyose/melibiose transport system permease protein
VVLGYVWQMIFDAILRHYNTYLTANATYGFWGLVILVAWQQIGYMMIIYIAGLQAVPGDMLEAAKIDGASGWQTLWSITIPNVMSSITICVFLTLTNSFKLFDQNLALTGGDPNHATEMLALNIYNNFYARSGAAWKGIGQAKAVVFCIMVIAISMIQLKATRSKEVQQ